jgi:hypothetical protein
LDWLSFFSSETKGLAWPVSALILALVFRAPLTKSVDRLGARLRTAKGAGVELSFGDEIDALESKLSPPANNEEKGNVVEQREQAALSVLPPAYVISRAWLQIENALRKALSDVNMSMPTRTSSSSLIKLAVDHELLSKDEADLVDSLRRLRNEAAHSLEPVITVTDALRYDDIVTSLTTRIKNRGELGPLTDNS